MAALSNFRRVLITDKIDQSCKAILEKNGVAVTLKPGMPKDEILQVIKVRFPSYSLANKNFLRQKFKLCCWQFSKHIFVIIIIIKNFVTCAINKTKYC